MGGSAAGSVDFPLWETPERRHTRFTILHISDTHVITSDDRRAAESLPPAAAGASEAAALRWKMKNISGKDLPDGAAFAADLHQAIVAASPDLVIATGDLTNVGTPGQLDQYHDAVRNAAVPVYSVFGGHDGNDERATYAPDTGFTVNYERVLGPVWYSFDWAAGT